MPEDRTSRRLAAILAADVASYSRLVGLDEEGTLRALRGLRHEVVEPLLSEHGGRIANTAGDSMLIEFASVVDAVRCALAIQEATGVRSAALPEERRLLFRIGINLGDVVSEGDDLLGDGVNVAARLEAAAEVGGIALSEDAYRQVRDRIDVAWADAGELQLKNIARPLRAWRWPGKEGAGSDAGFPSALDEKPSLAVLPFETMSGDEEQQYFADGIIEDIIAGLARLPGLLVISRNSSFTYKGRSVKAQEVCRDLGVRYILEGSVRKAGQRVRITARLIDGNSGGQLWAERYDRELADIFAVQDEVTECIVDTLEVTLVGKPVPRPELENPEAYDCVLRGREQYRRFTRDGNAAARDLFQQAIALDPDYAEAYAALSETCLHDWFHGDSAALDRGFDLAKRAESLNPSHPLVHEALGSFYLFKRRHAEAVAAAERWLEIEPGSAEAHANLAGLLQFAGKPERVAGLIEKAKQLNPFYPFFYTLYVGQAQFVMHRFEEAAKTISRSIAHNPDSLPAHFFLAACYGQLGETGRAREAVEAARKISPDLSLAQVRAIAAYKRQEDLALLIEGLQKAGLRDEAGEAREPV